MPEPCPVCLGDMWTCVEHYLTPLSHCCGADGMACRCNPFDDLPPDFLSRWSAEQPTIPPPTIN